jgi:hypothetical protein
MTRKLEETFNLPPIQDTTPDTEQVIEDIEGQKLLLDEANSIIDRIDLALPQVTELDSADREMDELADLAKEKFNDLMDLGMNVEARFSGTILQTAGVLLGHAITAKQAKLDKKLRMVDLQLKKMRLDQAAAKEGNGAVQAVDGHAVVLDRNELLRQVLSNNQVKN